MHGSERVAQPVHPTNFPSAARLVLGEQLPGSRTPSAQISFQKRRHLEASFKIIQTIPQERCVVTRKLRRNKTSNTLAPGLPVVRSFGDALGISPPAQDIARRLNDGQLPPNHLQEVAGACGAPSDGQIRRSGVAKLFRSFQRK